MPSTRLRNSIITVFVILWTLLFHYESIRYFYLNPLTKRDLPKTKFLFPPAGWIMFFNVDDGYGLVEVYGVKDNKPYFIDPHEILRTRTIGFDNIHRNILGEVASVDQSRPFCRFLRYRFPNFDKFLVTVIYYPSLTKERFKKFQEVRYQCAP